MQQIKSLNDLPLNTDGFIESLDCDGNIRRRLLDLGFVKGSRITPVLVSSLHDPRAFFIRGTLIAIRNDDAKLIQISF